jgi:membrane protease YdiL (CAAX protease family)
MDSRPVTSEPFPWRLFWLLLTAAILSVLAIFPIASDMVGVVLAKVGPPPIPLPLVLLLGAFQNLALLALVVWLGLKLSRRLGLRTPLLESWVYGRTASKAVAIQVFTSGLVAGLVVGIALMISLLALAPRLPNLPFVAVAAKSVWKRLLACFYGGVYEEVLTRLFLMALVAWIANRSWRKTAPKLSAGAFWFANIFAAILFGLGHLPSAAFFMTITPLVVVAALLLNGIAGIAFGYLYRKHGLESAMIAHFSADVFIWVVGPYFLRH